MTAEGPKYPVIYCDPPWFYNKRSAGSKFGAGASRYDLLKHEELLSMKPYIDTIAADNCALFMWVTGPRAGQGYELIQYWGFRFVTMFAFAWMKTNRDGSVFAGPGNYTASNLETVALGVRGRMPPRTKLVPAGLIWPRGKHSAKPERIAERIERMYQGPYIELFARRQRPGWHCTGMELDGLILGKNQPPQENAK